MKRSGAVLLLMFAGGCTQYNVVDAGPQSVGSLSLVPSHSWNKAPSMAAPGEVPTWTADGISLNSVSFFSDVEDGKPMVRSGKAGDFPVFRANMLPNEIVDVLEKTVAKVFSATIAGQGTLKPAVFAGAKGFEYQFEFVTPDNLNRKAFATGVVHDGRLQLVFYQGTRMVYFDKELPNVQAMLATATIK